MKNRESTLRNWAIRSSKESPEAWLVALAISLGTALKLWLDATTIGTNDVAYWYHFTRYVMKYGTVTIYRDIWYYNHPPLVSSVLSILGQVTAQAPYLFPFLFRLPAILADVGSTILLWKMASLYYGRRKALIGVSLFALNPVMIMVSGFHGNTDPIFIFWVLLAAYALVVRESCPASALCLGLAINIKIVPVMVVPAFLFWIPSWRRRLKFLGIMSAAVLAGFGYHFLAAFPDILKNVFFYGSTGGIWGLGRIFMPRQGVSPAGGHIWFPIISRYGLLALVVLSALIKSRQSFRSSVPDEKERGRHLLEAIGWAFLIVLIVSPGFGVQYLSWLVGPGIFLGMVGLFIYTLVASVFLFRVYTFWSGGFPWYYADSDTRGQWVGVDMLLDRALWILLVFWAAFLIIQGISAWGRTRSSRRWVPRKLPLVFP